MSVVFNLKVPSSYKSTDPPTFALSIISLLPTVGWFIALNSIGLLALCNTNPPAPLSHMMLSDELWNILKSPFPDWLPNCNSILSNKRNLEPSNVAFVSAFNTLAVFDPVIKRLSALLLTATCVLVSVESNVICPSLSLVMVMFAPPTNLTESSVPEGVSNNRFGSLLEPDTCCAFSWWVAVIVPPLIPKPSPGIRYDNLPAPALPSLSQKTILSAAGLSATISPPLTLKTSLADAATPNPAPATASIVSSVDEFLVTVIFEPPVIITSSLVVPSFNLMKVEIPAVSSTDRS